jgi:class 3 adenylate cyclase
MARLTPRLPWKRSIPAMVEQRQFFFVALMFGFGGVTALVAALLVDEQVFRDRNAFLVLGAVSATIGAVVFVLALVDASVIHRRFRHFVYSFLIGGGLIITAGQAAVGPVSIAFVVLYVAVPIFAVYHLPGWTAAAMIGLVSVEVAALVVSQDGYVAPAFTWAVVTGSLAVLGAVFGRLLGDAVDEVGNLGRLRRFLPVAVAEAVVSTPELLAPHRRQIAVVFCDLRGFTRFAAAVEPEDLVEVLDEYYRTTGTILDAAHATIGAFAGDGIMAFFNDPIPVADPAGQAVSVGVGLAGPMEDLLRRWRKRGFELSYGVGIAYGFATLGTFGFEGRNDYTALGPVVNIASRLCQAAGPAEVLVDRRTAEALDGRVELVERPVAAKGYDGPLTAFRVERLSEPSDAGRARPRQHLSEEPTAPT